MIKNDRQYKITNAQAAKFFAALGELSSKTQKNNLHPLLVKAQEEALRSQYEELQQELKEYTDLKSGKRRLIEIESIDQLPIALIQSRIARGLTQKELAFKLGLKEQQIQRYESTEYATASFSRLKQIIDVLDIKVDSKVFLTNGAITVKRLFQRLNNEIDLKRDFVIRRLLPNSISAFLENNTLSKDINEQAIALKAAAVIGRIFNWSVDNIFGDEPLTLSESKLGAIRFKLGKQTDMDSISVYTYFTILLAQHLLEATKNLPQKTIPTAPRVVRNDIITEYGSLNFENTLRYAWGLGIPVLPLQDSGKFHAACFRFEGQNIIVLKQNTKFESRWLSDLIHELYHAAQKPDEKEFAVIEDIDSVEEWYEDEEEQNAFQFASDVLLDCRAEELAKLCVNLSKGEMRYLKNTVVKVAKNENIDVGLIANYMAWRLSLQNEDWWGTAINLQRVGEKPWSIARDILFEFTDFSHLNDIDKNLLFQALSE